MKEVMKVAPVTLEGQHVRLEPLSKAHVPGLAEVGLDDDLWKWIPTPVRTTDEMSAYVQTALEEQARGVSLPFAVLEKATSRVIGSTRYGNIERTHHRVEIGWTWVARPWQRTPVNTEAKLLLLTHAFEQLGCMRVELKTDSLNERSRAAILRIGAQERHLSKPHDYGQRAHSTYGVFQHSRFGVAGSEGAPVIPPERQEVLALRGCVSAHYHSAQRRAFGRTPPSPNHVKFQIDPEHPSCL